LRAHGRCGASATPLKFSPARPEQAGKKERGFRGREFLPACLSVEGGLREGGWESALADFCPPPAAAGSQNSASGFCLKKVRILTKRDSTLLYSRFSASFCASPLRGSAPKWGKFPRHFSPAGRKNFNN